MDLTTSRLSLRAIEQVQGELQRNIRFFFIILMHECILRCLYPDDVTLTWLLYRHTLRLGVCSSPVMGCVRMDGRWHPRVWLAVLDENDEARIFDSAMILAHWDDKVQPREIRYIPHKLREMRSLDNHPELPIERTVNYRRHAEVPALTASRRKIGPHPARWIFTRNLATFMMGFDHYLSMQARKQPAIYELMCQFEEFSQQISQVHDVVGYIRRNAPA